MDWIIGLIGLALWGAIFYAIWRAAKTARKNRRMQPISTGSAGTILQLVGFFCLFITWPIGLILGLVLMALGTPLARRCRCPNCGNALDSKKVRICPTCRTVFGQSVPGVHVAEKKQPDPAILPDRIKFL